MLRGLVISFTLISACFADTNELTLLSSTEADAIIAEREAAKAERKAARRAELEKAEVISEGEGILLDGRKVIVREVQPPARVASKEPISETLTAPSFTPEQLALNEQNKELQFHKVQMLSCTVYDRSVTEVRWKHDGENYLAFTNADFNYLRGIMTVKTETDRYDYFFGIGNASSDQLRQPLPTLPEFSSDHSEYVLVEGDSENYAATAGLEALLAHYDSNLPELKSAYERSQALAAAHKRYKAANPEAKEDFILQFWVPETKGAGE